MVKWRVAGFDDECDDSSDLWWFAGVMVVRQIVLSFDELKRVKELAVLTRLKLGGAKGMRFAGRKRILRTEMVAGWRR